MNGTKRATPTDTVTGVSGQQRRPQQPLRLGSRIFPPDELVLMAVVNRTPDSFYDRGATYRLDRAVAAAEAALDEGAAIVDIGGVKAGHGKQVSVAEEIDRVCPVIASIRHHRPEAVLSVDTWRASVARAAVEAGADLINDAWEGYDPELPLVAARAGVGLVCAHAGHQRPRTTSADPWYDDVVDDVVDTITELASRAVAVGVRPDGILIDPAHDFGKSTLHSLEITRRLGELVNTGWPVLAAVSNKDFIGETLGRPVTERLSGTLAVVSVAAWLGARVFRVHNVEEVKQALAMVAALRGDRQSPAGDSSSWNSSRQSLPCGA